MELRSLWKIIKRRWWLIALPAVAAFLYALYGYLNSPETIAYSATVRFTAATPPENDTSYEDEQYYPWLASEYVANAFTDWVRTSSFATEVSATLQQDDINISPASIQSSIAADNARSIMLLTITRGNPEEVIFIADAAAAVLDERANDYFPQFGDSLIGVVPLDQPVPGAVPPPITNRLDPFFRFGLGLAAGIGLAFLIEYLDPRLYERDQFESLNLPILATIPSERRFLKRR